MLHEVLLALLGCPGDVFVDSPSLSQPGSDPAEPQLVVAADVPLAGPEREALNRLVRRERGAFLGL